MRPIPKRLYKYRPFKTDTVIELERNVVYYADPKDFNDPLDCSPVVHVDINVPELERLCFKMLVQVRGPKADQQAAKVAAGRRIDKMRYDSTEPDWDGGPVDVESVLRRYLARDIQECLERLMRRKGVFSLAQKWNCPLMWSHYAEQHKGICIEYDTSQLEFGTPCAIDYSGIRDIKASDLYDWQVKRLTTARDRVHNSYFYRKARQWGYEKEWRHVRDSNGVDASPYLMSAINFGLRCDTSVETMIAKLFRGAKREPALYRICEDTKTFKLKRYRPNLDELLYESPSISQYWREKALLADFQNLSD